MEFEVDFYLEIPFTTFKMQSFLNKKEKIVFLSLAYHVAQLDQVVTEETLE